MSSLKGIFSIAGWTLLGQVAYLAVIPIIARLYPEASIARFGSFMAIVGIIAPASCLRIPSILPVVANHLVTSSSRLALTSLTLVSALAYWATATGILSFTHINGGSYDAFFMFLILFSNGLWQILSGVSTRYRQFNEIGLSKATQGIVTAICQILAAGASLKSMGLLIGDATGKASSLIALRTGVRVFFAPTNFGVTDAAKKHFHLITKGTLASLCSGFALQSLPIVFIAIWSAEAAASVFLVQMALRAPAGIMSQSISKVFVSDYSLCNSTDSKKILQRNYLVNMIKVGALPALVLFLFAPSLITSALGDNFHSSSLLVRPLLVSTISLVASSSLSQMLILNNRPGLQLAWDAARAISLVLLFSACKLWELEINGAIWLFALLMAIFDIAHLVISRITTPTIE